MATIEEIAWAAGIFEGEGCIVIPRTGDRAFTRVVIKLKMTDRDIVDRWQRIVNAGNVVEDNYYRNKGHKPQFGVQIGKREEVVRILTELRPWLGERRAAAADEALALIDSFPTKYPRDRWINQQSRS